MPVAVAQPLPSVSRAAQDTITTLFSFLEQQGQGDYLGEAISQLQHSLQCAHLAYTEAADDDTILGALLHDVGRFIPRSDHDKMPPMIAPDGTFVGGGSHEILGESYLRQLDFSDKVCELVGSHVWAKRYLTATEPDYYEGLSRLSKTSLKYQGGPLTKEQVESARDNDPWMQAKLDVRRWDDQAKVPDLEVPGLTAYKDMAVQSLLASRGAFTLHGRTYRLPTRPTVAICVDGFDPTYLARGIADGILRNIAVICETGFSETAHAAMPTFTNPNNCSIITGAPTSVHGIAGNFYLDPESGEEKQVVDDTLLRGSTILEQLSRRGVRVAAITAKDKLRRIIQHGLDSSKDICFSSEYAGQCTFKVNGIEDVEGYVGRPAPPQYSGDLSLFVLDAGIRLLTDGKADVFYLTLSDYIQHKHAPGTKESNDFLSALDDKVGQLVGLGAAVGITGDHGMSDKCGPEGSPNVLYVQDELESRFGTGCARVVCPITDPFVKHHGALGSFVRIHLPKDTTGAADGRTNEMMECLKAFPQVLLVVSGQQAAERFEMPLDREGDIVVVSTKHAVFGSKKDEHDLENLKGHRLRSHGGLSEQDVPLLMTGPARPGLKDVTGDRQWRNFDVYDLLLNWA